MDITILEVNTITKKFASAIFLFNVEYLINKVSLYCSLTTCKLFLFRLNNRQFFVNFGSVSSRHVNIKAGIPRSSFLDLIFYLLFTYSEYHYSLFIDNKTKNFR